MRAGCEARAVVGSRALAYGASLIIGLFIVWVLAAFGVGWPPAVMLGLGAVCAALAMLVAWRIGALGRDGAWTDAPLRMMRAILALPNGLMSAFGVAAAAFGVRRGKPGLVRLKLEPGSVDNLDRVIEALSAQPGLIAVDADAGSALLHAHNEDGVRIDSLKARERAAAGRAP